MYAWLEVKVSRVRRGDARLYFPDRVVQMHKVDATTAERQLIDTIAMPIQQLNRLAQISILQALTSSPDALMAQLNNMARNRTVPQELAATVRAIVAGMPASAKLQGLGGLIDRLKRENPERWRLVVFTGRLETQTTIQAFLEKYGLKVGIINGRSGPRNQETIARFRKHPPDCHVIVCTEAGSEGVNLQVANVLVNHGTSYLRAGLVGGGHSKSILSLPHRRRNIFLHERSSAPFRPNSTTCRAPARLRGARHR